MNLTNTINNIAKLLNVLPSSNRQVLGMKLLTYLFVFKMTISWFQLHIEAKALCSIIYPYLQQYHLYTLLKLSLYMLLLLLFLALIITTIYMILEFIQDKANQNKLQYNRYIEYVKSTHCPMIIWITNLLLILSYFDNSVWVNVFYRCMNHPFCIILLIIPLCISIMVTLALYLGFILHEYFDSERFLEKINKN